MADLPETIREISPVATAVHDDVVELQGALTQLRVISETIDARSIQEIARFMVMMHRIKAQLIEVDKAFSSSYEKLKNETVPSALEAAGVTSVPLAEGFRVGMSNLTRASIKPGQKDSAFAWLRANGLGDLITETVNSSTLSAATKSMVEDLNLEPPDDLFNVVVLPNTSVTQTKR